MDKTYRSYQYIWSISLLRKRTIKRLLRNKKAVSPAISSVIMSAAVITVGLIVLTWANNNFSTRQQEGAKLFYNQSQLMSENFVIEDVWFYPNGVNVTIRNIGTNTVNITSLKFNETILFDTSQLIPIKQASIITVNWNWGTGTQYYNILVKTARDQSITETFCTTG